MKALDVDGFVEKYTEDGGYPVGYHLSRPGRGPGTISAHSTMGTLFDDLGTVDPEWGLVFVKKLCICGSSAYPDVLSCSRWKVSALHTQGRLTAWSPFWRSRRRYWRRGDEFISLNWGFGFGTARSCTLNFAFHVITVHNGSGFFAIIVVCGPEMILVSPTSV